MTEPNTSLPNHILGNKILGQLTSNDRFTSYTINYGHGLLSRSANSIASGHPAISRHLRVLCRRGGETGVGRLVRGEPSLGRKPYCRGCAVLETVYSIGRPTWVRVVLRLEVGHDSGVRRARQGYSEIGYSGA